MSAHNRQSIEYAFLSLLAFFDIYNQPLTLEEIKKHMYQYDLLDQELYEILEESTHVERKGEYFFLKGKVENVYIRKKRQEYIRKYWKKVFRFVPFLRYLPFVRMVGICNTLAFQTCDENSDIDLFIVIEKRHLWISRLLITAYFQLTGTRRHGSKTRGRFCLSFFTTTDNLDLSYIAKEPYDIYLAYWISTLVPVFGEPWYERFLEENDPFLQEYFGSKIVKNNARCLPASPKAERIQQFQERIWENSFMHGFSEMLASWQKKRALRKLRRLRPGHSNVVSDRMFKSHDRDKRDYFRQEYEERMGAMGLL